MDASDAETAFYVAEADKATGMTDLDRLREALERYRLHQAGVSDIDDIYEAARRFLALTETGPDYEAAEALFDEGGDLEWDNGDGLAVDALVRKIIDAALADYLGDADA